MAIFTSCPACREEFHVPLSQKGKRVQCTSCREPFVVRPDDPDEPAEQDEDLPVLHEAPEPRREERRVSQREERRPPPRRRREEEYEDEEDEEREPARSHVALFVVGG